MFDPVHAVRQAFSTYPEVVAVELEGSTAVLVVEMRAARPSVYDRAAEIDYQLRHRDPPYALIVRPVDDSRQANDWTFDYPAVPIRWSSISPLDPGLRKPER